MHAQSLERPTRRDESDSEGAATTTATDDEADAHPVLCSHGMDSRAWICRAAQRVAGHCPLTSYCLCDAEQLGKKHVRLVAQVADVLGHVRDERQHRVARCERRH